MQSKHWALLTAFLILGSDLFSQNIVVNPGAESPVSTGWTIVNQGANCNGAADWRVQGNQSGLPAAHAGDYFFYSGCNTSGEIYQDIDVSQYADEIDESNRNFTFIGYMQVGNEASPDKSQMIIEYRNASDAKIVIYNTGQRADKGVWTSYTSTITAPIGTRKVRIRLLSHSVTGPSVDAYFDDISLTSVALLPLQLVSFITIVNSKNEVEATWKTANEMNNDRFELQRSADGISWESVATVKGSGTTSSGKSYSAIDRFPLNGQSFYRLMQFDFDGKTSVSKINSVRINSSENKILIFPNPAATKITVGANLQTLSDLKIYDSKGQDVTSNTKQVRNSSSQVEINIAELPSGIYFIKSGTQSGSFYKK